MVNKVYATSSPTLMGYSSDLNSNGKREYVPTVFNITYIPLSLLSLVASKRKAAMGMRTMRMAFSWTWNPNKKALSVHSITPRGKSPDIDDDDDDGFLFHRRMRIGIVTNSVVIAVVKGPTDGNTLNPSAPIIPEDKLTPPPPPPIVVNLLMMVVNMDDDDDDDASNVEM